MQKNRSRQTTIDASSLCAIEHLNLFRELAFLFDQIHIPRRVREEFAKKFKSRKILARLPGEFAPYRDCNAADEVSIRILLAEVAPHRRKPRGDEGEAEAIVQASQIGVPTVVIDDRQGRQWARNRGLTCRGTLWILEQLRALDLIPAIRPMIDILRRNEIRLPASEIKRLLEKFQEE